MSAKDYKTIGLTLNEKQREDLITETEKFAELVSIKLTPQKFLIKLLYDHIKRNSNNLKK